MTIKVGDKLPDVKLTRATENGPEQVSSAEYFKGKKVALFAVPGAFTPTCSVKHLPGYKEKAAELRAKGVGAVVELFRKASELVDEDALRRVHLVIKPRLGENADSVGAAGEVEADALLAPVPDLPRERWALGHDPGVDEPAHRIPAGWLDLDDLCPPVGQHGSGDYTGKHLGGMAVQLVHQYLLSV